MRLTQAISVAIIQKDKMKRKKMSMRATINIELKALLVKKMHLLMRLIQAISVAVAKKFKINFCLTCAAKIHITM